jgi:hypothetical protein
MIRKLGARGLGLSDLAAALLPASPDPRQVWTGPAPRGLSPAIARELLRDLRRSPDHPGISAWERANIEIMALAIEMGAPLSTAQQQLLRAAHAKLAGRP